MTHLEIKRDAYGWKLLLDGTDIKDRCLGFTLETNEGMPAQRPVARLYDDAYSGIPRTLWEPAS